MSYPACFKAYDIRGRLPDELNVDIAFRIGVGFAQQFRPGCVALGRDVRHSSASLLQAVAKGLATEGVEVIDIGLCGTEEIYWAAQQPGIDAGIEITASHNPIDYNGMKLVLGGAIPVSGDSGLTELGERVAASTACMPEGDANMTARSYRDSYIQHLLGYVDRKALRPLRILVNAGNSGAGAIIDALEPHLPFEFFKIHHEPDGSFPNGIPNPLLPGNRKATSDAVLEHGADFGVAWDGDFDRCFIFDEMGQFVEGYYIVGLLAAALLEDHPGEKVIHDPRLTWNTIDVVSDHGGVPVQSKTGHAFIKERMRSENAIYGGEMSAHHYFRTFGYCDNGNIPWLLLAALLSKRGKPLSHELSARIARFPSSGELNYKVADVANTLEGVEAMYARDCESIDRTDGISLNFENWRFNLRGSNTEAVIRLNVETRGDKTLLKHRTEELVRHIESFA